MRWLSAGLTFVNFATVAGLIAGILTGGLNPFCASIALFVGTLAGIFAYLRTTDPQSPELPSEFRYRDVWKWLIAVCFVIFAVRSFCWLLYIDGDELKIQSPNNLGDLSLHITYIKNFANGVPLWPDNPICVGSKLRYPAGTDLFNALLYLQHVDLIRGFVWVGLLGSIATFYALYRWGRTFGVAGFLFNGGLIGFQFLATRKFEDYQGVSSIAWKSIPLSMFVTQRGLLYAIPAGLLLLWHWREKFFRNSVAGIADPGPADGAPTRQGSLPLWVELSLYASMPLFHVHTFLALSAVLVCLAVFGDSAMRKHVGILIVSAFVPATFLVWLISDQFHARSVFAFQPGWVQNEGDFADPIFKMGPLVFTDTIPILGWMFQKTWNGLIAPFFQFWLVNFGLWVPAVLGLLWICGKRIGKSGWRFNQKLPEDAAFLLPAVAIFGFAFFVKTAPWGWDNLKIMIWAYFLVLPFLWSEFTTVLSRPLRVIALVALFGSGFVSLFGGLAAGRNGFGFAERAEIDGVGHAVRNLPVTARFAAYPTYNHPLLLQGRKVVLGYPGHLWTEGFDYAKTMQQLEQLMNGAENWRDLAHTLQVQYIFWGREETANYHADQRPWEKAARLLDSGPWGAIYEVEPLKR
jgi:hypothetical protein